MGNPLDGKGLRGVTTQVEFSVVDLNRNEDWSATLKFRTVLTVESTSCLGYFIYDIIIFNLVSLDNGAKMSPRRRTILSLVFIN